MPNKAMILLRRIQNFLRSLTYRLATWRDRRNQLTEHDRIAARLLIEQAGAGDLEARVKLEKAVAALRYIRGLK